MNTYITLLRGINVSGKNLLKMDALKSIFETLKCTNVQTYIQSGNVVFNSKEDAKKLASKIKKEIEIKFGFIVPTIVLTIEELKSIASNNPFQNKEEFLQISIFGEVPIETKEDKFLSKKSPNEDFKISENAFYLYCPDGYGKTKLSNTLIESTLKVTATTRNWKTITTLIKMAES